MSHTKPFLKWAGGKYRLLDKILNTLPPGKRLIEPFGGSGAVFLNAKFDEFLISEANLDLVRLYQQLQQEGEAFIHYCASYFTPKNNQAHVYYKHRTLFNACTDPRERAALFLYLNRHGYNGLCRYNLSGKFNVPFGSYVRPYFPTLEMNHFYIKSQSAMFIHQDFRQTFAQLQQGDVIYCDPPYVKLSKTSSFTAYTGRHFSEEDQITLAQLAETASKNGNDVVISNHDTPFTRMHYQKSKISSFPVQRYISCAAQGRNEPVQELIALFNRCE